MYKMIDIYCELIYTYKVSYLCIIFMYYMQYMYLYSAGIYIIK